MRVKREIQLNLLNSNEREREATQNDPKYDTILIIILSSKLRWAKWYKFTVLRIVFVFRHSTQQHKHCCWTEIDKHDCFERRSQSLYHDYDSFGSLSFVVEEGGCEKFNFLHHSTACCCSLFLIQTHDDDDDDVY